MKMYTVEEALSKLVEVTGLDLCVAGGAVRDMLHNKMPKDLDIEILSIPYEPCSHAHMEEHILQPLYDNISKAGAKDIRVYTEYEGASLDAHVEFVIKCRFNNWYCDIILRRPHPQSTSELVEMYDMNINQVTLHKGHIEVHKPVEDNIILPTGKKISISRLKRIYSKYPEYDFSRMIPFTYEEAELRETE